MSPEQWRAFLDSLEGEKGLPEEMHGWRFYDNLADFESRNMPSHPPLNLLVEMIDYLVERCRRAESRQTPDLKERVKELVLCAMDAQKAESWANHISEYQDAKKKAAAYRELCAPEVKP